MSIEHDIESRLCFLCGDLLPHDFILWQGADERGAAIALHEGCACTLASHLLSDAAKFRLGDRAA